MGRSRSELQDRRRRSTRRSAFTAGSATSPAKTAAINRSAGTRRRTAEFLANGPRARRAIVSGGHEVLPGAGGDVINLFTIKQDTCVGCNMCSLVCPVDGCITMKEVDTGQAADELESVSGASWRAARSTRSSRRSMREANDRSTLHAEHEITAQHFIQAIDQEIRVVAGHAHRRLDAQRVAEQAALADQQAALLAQLEQVGRLGRGRLFRSGGRGPARRRASGPCRGPRRSAAAAPAARAAGPSGAPPTRRAFSWIPSLSITSSVASPCVIEIGLPPKVLK